MDSRTDPRVDQYVAALPGWQQAICQRVRRLAHATDDEMRETVKRKGQPYFVLEGNVCALLAAARWVTVLLYTAELDDPAGIITGGHDNTTGRYIRLRQEDALDEVAFVDLLRQCVAFNRAGRARTTRAR